MLIVKMPSMPDATNVFDISCCDKVEAVIGHEDKVIGVKLIHFGADNRRGETYEETISFIDSEHCSARIQEAYVEGPTGRTIAYYTAGQTMRKPSARKASGSGTP